MKVYIIDRRSNRVEDVYTEESNVFVGSSVKKCVKFMRDNDDYDERKYIWWWVIIECAVDLDIFNCGTKKLTGKGDGIIAAYDWNGNKMDELYPKIKNRIK